ncbi:hypothetical protein FBU30_005862 [Linnemannia zychae]|nr:hypothetical protein FBU30_005862 [Linnemannia zychae]
MFLWFMTLAGLSVEPIADSLFSSRIMMYEGIKIMFAGWLLLAHFDISKPRPRPLPPHQSDIIPGNNIHQHQHQHQRTQHLSTQHDRHSNTSRQSSYISTTEQPQRIKSRQGHASSSINADGENGKGPLLRAANLDFGRFKRDLERRRSHSRTHSHATEEPITAIPSRASSRLGITESSLSTQVFSKDEIKFTQKTAPVTPRATLLEQELDSSKSSPAVTVAAASFQSMSPQQELGSAKLDKRSTFDVFLFGREKHSLKRSSSVMLEEKPLPSLTRKASNMSTRSQPRPSTLQSAIHNQREHRVRINAESPAGKGKRQRHSVDEKDRGSELEDKEKSHERHVDNNQIGKNNKMLSGHTDAPEATSISEPVTANADKSASSTKFSRPQPPKKANSKIQSNVPKSSESASMNRGQSLPEPIIRDMFSPSATETAEEIPLASASFETRMKNVRAWIKGRNPSMISPTLTATSAEASASAQHSKHQLKRQSSSFLQDEKSNRNGDLGDLSTKTKRKAARQLAPSSNTKRWAAEDDQERPSQQPVAPSDEKVQQHTPNSSRRRGGDTGSNEREADKNKTYTDQTMHLLETGSSDRPRGAKDFSFSQPIPASRRSSLAKSKEYHSNRTSSSLPTSVDWDRFQKFLETGHPKRSLSSTSTLFTSPSTKLNAYQTYPRTNSVATTLYDRDDNHLNVAPLIKLRQSQLRQHQEEDFLGIKRVDPEANKSKFDSTLDLWEREDDETLARNAAREAEEVETRSQMRLSQTRRDSSSSESQPPEGAFTFTSPSRISGAAVLERDYEMAAPAPSLLRTIPFNGESSRRPVPDFLPKKPVSAVATGSSPRRNLTSLHDNSHRSNNPFLEKLSIYSGDRSAPPPPRFNFNFAGAASLAKKRAQAQQAQQQKQQSVKPSPEDIAARRERHPGLYTPSKKKAISGAISAPVSSSEQESASLWKGVPLSRPSSSPFKQQLQQQQKHQPSTPTAMSRYIELSNLSDEEDD